MRVAHKTRGRSPVHGLQRTSLTSAPLIRAYHHCSNHRVSAHFSAMADSTQPPHEYEYVFLPVVRSEGETRVGRFEVRVSRAEGTPFPARSVTWNALGYIATHLVRWAETGSRTLRNTSGEKAALQTWRLETCLAACANVHFESLKIPAGPSDPGRRVWYRVCPSRNEFQTRNDFRGFQTPEPLNELQGLRSPSALVHVSVETKPTSAGTNTSVTFSSCLDGTAEDLDRCKPAILRAAQNSSAFRRIHSNRRNADSWKEAVSVLADEAFALQRESNIEGFTTEGFNQPISSTVEIVVETTIKKLKDSDPALEDLTYDLSFSYSEAEKSGYAVCRFLLAKEEQEES